MHGNRLLAKTPHAASWPRNFWPGQALDSSMLMDASNKAKVLKFLTSSSKKRVGDAATERCRFSVPEGVSEATDGERTFTGVSAEAAKAVNLVVRWPCKQGNIIGLTSV